MVHLHTAPNMLYIVHADILCTPFNSHYLLLTLKVCLIFHCVYGRQVLLRKIMSIRVWSIQCTGNLLVLQHWAIGRASGQPINCYKWTYASCHVNLPFTNILQTCTRCVPNLCTNCYCMFQIDFSIFPM